MARPPSLQPRPPFPHLLPPISLPPLPVPLLPLPVPLPCSQQTTTAPILNPSVPPITPTPPPAPWKALCFPLGARSRTLSFIEPIVVDNRRIASCLCSEIEKGTTFWEDTLFGCVVGLKAHLPTLKKVLLSKWKLTGSLEISHQSDLFVFRFGDGAKKQRVLENGPWFVSGHLLVLRPWSRNIQSLGKNLSSLPIWIQIPGLPLEFWTPDSLCRIGSQVGTPLLSDEYTANRSRTTFARICVEATPLKPLPDFVWIDIEGSEAFEQRIAYEWRPSICTSCCKFFHLKENCGKDSKISANSSDKEKGKAKVIQKDSQKVSRATNEWRVVQHKNSKHQGTRTIGSASKAKPNNRFELLGLPKEDVGESSSPRSDLSGGLEICKGNIPAGDPVPTNGETQVRPDGLVLQQLDGSAAKESGNFVGEQNGSAAVEITQDYGAKGSQALQQTETEALQQTEMEEMQQIETEALQQALPDFSPEDPVSEPIGSISGELWDVYRVVDGTTFRVEGDRDGEGTKAGEIISPRVVGSALAVIKGPSVSPFAVFKQNSELVFQNDGDISILSSVDYNSAEHILFNPTKPDFIQTPNLRPNLTHTNQLDSLPCPDPINQSLPKTSNCLSIVLPAPCPSRGVESEESSSESDDSIPPGFTPTRDNLDILRRLIKERVTMIPEEHQKGFIESVDHAEDKEILEFFKEKFKNLKSPIQDPNFVIHHGLRRSPRIKKKPDKLTDPSSKSGLKKGFLK